MATVLSAQVGDSLEEFLVANTQDAKLRQLMMSMSEAIRTIAFKVGAFKHVTLIKLMPLKGNIYFPASLPRHRQGGGANMT